MRIITLLSLIVTLAISSLAKSANVAGNNSSPAPPSNSVLRARVFYADTGRPIKRTSVMLMTNNRSGREGSGVDGWSGWQSRDQESKKQANIMQW